MKNNIISKVKLLGVCLILLGAMVIFTPTKAQAGTCGNVKLDLVCPSGQYLKGIDSKGNKICVKNAFIPYGSYKYTPGTSGKWGKPAKCYTKNPKTGACSCGGGAITVGMGNKIYNCYKAQ